ncbi:MAG: outer membrane homotrimeric porin [Proteobacteria bacterium]|nr:outer membrane homotrimeric porin [Pseudomonadota bacterium]MBU1594444.1 outer membrane homotrimeric porin [Pseudomonadota bacterium]
MKKLSVFAIVGLLVLGLAASASAAEIKASGSFKIEANEYAGTDFLKNGAIGQGKSFNIEQRIRTAFTFIANENLKAVLETQIGPTNWGNGQFAIGSGRGTTNNVAAAAGTATAAGNGGNGNLMLRKGYIDFKWPGTKTNFLVGFETVSLPAAFGGGSAILDDQVAAAVMVTPVTDNLTLLAGYARPFDANSAATTTASTLSGSATSTDVFFAALPIDFKGFNITPFAAYANAGAETAADSLGATALPGFYAANASTSEGVRAYWGGVATTITAIDNFKIMADFNYGKATWNNQGVANKASGGRSGWLADIAVDYTGLKMMTPSAFFVYSSGEKGNSTDSGSKSGRMPVVANPQNWAVGSFFFGDRNSATNPTNGGTTSRQLGFWVAGVSLKDMTFIDKLSHTAHLMYVKGTNDKKFLSENGNNGISALNRAYYGSFLTTKDSLWEVDFNTKYMIFDELALTVNLGYINTSFDKNVWGAATSVTNAADIRTYGDQDAYRASLGLTYSF